MTDVALSDGRLYIAGEWRSGRGPELRSVFPADGSTNAVLAGASPDDVDLAIDAAVTAQRQASWGALKAHERAAILHRISDGIARNIARIAHIQSRDTGKTLTETRALAQSAAGTFRYMAAALETLEDALPPPRGDALTISVHEPIGVVAAITPWNSPIASDAQKVAPALAADNAVILKPASWSPLVSLELARIIEESGLPKGLFSVLPGAGGSIGDRLASHPAVGKVAFTGGTDVGRRIARRAADKLIPVSLELGGKSPTIVFADCDEDVAIAGILFGIFSSSGQSCIAGSRLFVERAIYDKFVGRLVRAAKALKVGHPFEAGTQVAPLVRSAHRDAVEAHVARARSDGGEMLTGGVRPSGPGFDAGYYYAPTIIAGLGNQARLCQDEVFGPVLAVLPFESEDQLIAEANASAYGLAAGLWTRDFVKAWRVARALDAGTIWINTYKQFSIATPFGGLKESGIGREKGRDGIRAYQQQKALYVDLSGRPHPWSAETAERMMTSPHIVGNTVDVRERMIEGALELSNCQIANIDLSGTTFAAPVRFVNVTFLGQAWYRGCRFLRDVEFTSCLFENDARFDGAEFSGAFRFHDVELRGIGSFNHACFRAAAHFESIAAYGNLSFDATAFSGPTRIERTQCLGGLWIDRIQSASHIDLSGLEVHGRTWIQGTETGGTTQPVTYGYTYAALGHPLK
jgi:betaine-aldehyde dehydrogenase